MTVVTNKRSIKHFGRPTRTRPRAGRLRRRCPPPCASGNARRRPPPVHRPAVRRSALPRASTLRSPWMPPRRRRAPDRSTPRREERLHHSSKVRHHHDQVRRTRPGPGCCHHPDRPSTERSLRRPPQPGPCRAGQRSIRSPAPESFLMGHQGRVAPEPALLRTRSQRSGLLPQAGPAPAARSQAVRTAVGSVVPSSGQRSPVTRRWAMEQRRAAECPPTTTTTRPTPRQRNVPGAGSHRHRPGSSSTHRRATRASTASRPIRRRAGCRTRSPADHRSHRRTRHRGGPSARRRASRRDQFHDSRRRHNGRSGLRRRDRRPRRRRPARGEPARRWPRRRVRALHRPRPPAQRQRPPR